MPGLFCLVVVLAWPLMLCGVWRSVVRKNLFLAEPKIDDSDFIWLDNDTLTKFLYICTSYIKSIMQRLKSYANTQTT